MASYNKVLLMGNLTRDPQLTYLPSNTPVAEFGLAVNRRFKKQDGEMGEEVLFADCRAFGRTGEIINQYFQKGRPIFVEGRLKLDQWTDKEGNKRSKLYVVVEAFEFVGSRDGAGGGDQGEGAARAPRQGSAPQRSAPPPPEPAPEMAEDDIPF